MKVGRGNSSVADLLPLSSSRKARVNNSAEFSSSTVATSISFATVIIAFFELAGYFGLWLLWTAGSPAWLVGIGGVLLGGALFWLAAVLLRTPDARQLPAMLLRRQA